jgi:hypothetical protein
VYPDPVAVPNLVGIDGPVETTNWFAANVGTMTVELNELNDTTVDVTFSQVDAEARDVPHP